MKLIFVSKNNKEITYSCTSVFVGMDNRDLYIVHDRQDSNGKVFRDHDLIARFYDEEWHPVNNNSLLWGDPILTWRLEEDSVMLDSAAALTRRFEVGWERGYSSGYAVGKLHSGENSPNGALIDFYD